METQSSLVRYHCAAGTDSARIALAARCRMKSDTRIMVDSVACLPEAVAEEHGITVIPVRIAVAGTTYCDTFESLSSTQIRSLQESPTIDTTPWPPEHYARCYQSAGASAKNVLHVVASSQFTSTISLARAGAAMAEEWTPGLRVEVIDSATTGIAQGFVARAAAAGAAADAAFGDVRVAAERMRSQVRSLFALDNLRYVARTGRVKGLTAWATSLLRVRPLVGLDQGRERPLGLARSTSIAMERLLLMIEREAGGGSALHIGVVRSGWPDEAEEFRRQATERLGPGECLIAEASPVTQVVAGPGMLDIAYYVDV